MLPFKTI